MSLNDSMTDWERAQLAVWDYPVSDKFTKVFQTMTESGFLKNTEEGVARVRRQINKNEFAFVGDATDIKYMSISTCDLMYIGEEMSRKPYGIAVQQGSPLKEQLSNE